MEKRILAYRKRIDELLKQEDANWAKVLEEHLTQVAFFQHERLIHLIVTVLFAVLEIMSILGTVILAAMDKGNIALSIMTILLLVLLIPYIRHYYILENEVQKMYGQYDELLKKVNEKEKKMQNLSDLIKERRSIKKYKADVMVEEELIDKVIEAGLYAASGRGKQAPVIIAVTDKELRDKIAEKNCQIGGFQEGFDPFYGAPVILIVIADATVNTAVYDGSLALGNMMLMAHELGLGSCWIHRAKEEFEDDFGKEILKDLGIEGDYVGVGHLALGYADTELPEVPARKDNRVYYAR